MYKLQFGDLDAHPMSSNVLADGLDATSIPMIQPEEGCVVSMYCPSPNLSDIHNGKCGVVERLLRVAASSAIF